MIDCERMRPVPTRGKPSSTPRAIALSSDAPELHLPALDPSTVADLHDRLFPELYRYAHFRTGDPSIAEDVAAESFLRLLEAVRRKRGPSGPRARGWLFGTASHLIADHFRRRFGRPEDSISDGVPTHEPGPSQVSEKKDAARSMRSAIARLTPDQQRVLDLRFHAEMSVIEVAEILGKQPNAIKALQFRALTALRRALEEER